MPGVKGVEDAGNAAVRRVRLKKAIITRFTAMGATCWETPRSSDGAPGVSMIWAGMYYGFYISGFPLGSGADISHIERETMQRINDNGGVATIVASIDAAETVLNMNLRITEVRRAMPTKKVAAQVKLWSRGKLKGSVIEAEIEALPADLRTTIFGLYVDDMKVNQMAEASGVAITTVLNRHRRALNTIAERLVEKGTYLEGLGKSPTQ